MRHRPKDDVFKAEITPSNKLSCGFRVKTDRIGPLVYLIAPSKSIAQQWALANGIRNWIHCDNIDAIKEQGRFGFCDSWWEAFGWPRMEPVVYYLLPKWGEQKLEEPPDSVEILLAKLAASYIRLSYARRGILALRERLTKLEDKVKKMERQLKGRG